MENMDVKHLEEVFIKEEECISDEIFEEPSQQEGIQECLQEEESDIKFMNILNPQIHLLEFHDEIVKTTDQRRRSDRNKGIENVNGNVKEQRNIEINIQEKTKDNTISGKRKTHKKDKHNKGKLFAKGKYNNVKSDNIKRTDEDKRSENKCETCSMMFLKPSDLRRHRRTHTKETPFKCELCHKEYSQSYNLKRHEETHTNIKKWTCYICAQEFTRKYALQRHLACHDNKRELCCPLCPEKFNRRFCLTQHLERIHKNCFIKGTLDLKKMDVGKDKMAKNMDKNVKVKNVDKNVAVKSVDKKGNRNGDRKTNKNEDKNVMDVDTSVMVQHAKYVKYKPVKAKPVKDKLAKDKLAKGKLVNDKPAKDESTTDGSTTDESTTDESTKAESTMDELNKDESTNDSPVNDKHSTEIKSPQRCVLCNGVFAEHHDLTRHPASHLEDKPFKCNICDTYFGLLSSVVVHLRTHDGNPTVDECICEVCDETFLDATSLRAHIGRHLADFPYSCKICLKKFTDKSQLVTHMLQHTVETPYRCHKCGDLFSHVAALRGHFRSHLDNDSFVSSSTS